MEEFFKILKDYQWLIILLITTLGFIIPLYKYLVAISRKNDQEAFDKIGTIVGKAPNQETSYLDEQIMAVFGLRYYPKYFSVIDRILQRNIQSPLWKDYDSLIEEATRTRVYIGHNKTPLRRFWNWIISIFSNNLQ